MARMSITDGPGKWNLMLSLFDSETRSTEEDHAVSFAVDRDSMPKEERNTNYGKVLLEITDTGWVGYTGTVIKSIKDLGDNEKWGFTGHLQSNPAIKFQGEFSTKTRKGWVEITDYQK